ncbi:MAG: DUF7793 family protein [Bacteroidia bacterium]
MMTPPENTEIHESIGGTWWIKNDILYSVGKKNAPKPTPEEAEKELELFKKIVGNKKICMILDISTAKPSSREERDRAAVELEKLVKAMAMVTTSPFSRMVANLFFGLKPPSYPVKMCSSVEEAEEWIKQYV